MPLNMTKTERLQLNRFALPALMFLLGIGVSSAVYWLFLAPENSNQSTDPLSTLPDRSTTPSTVGRSTANQPTSSTDESHSGRANLEEILQINSPFDRGTALRNVLANTDEDGAFELLTQSLELPSRASSRELQSAIIQRLAQVNPARALSSAIKLDKRERFLADQLVPSLFSEWAQTSLDEAISSARSLEESTRRSALEAILQERLDLSRENIRTIARDLGDEQIADALFMQLEVEAAVENPAELWNELVTKLQDDAHLSMQQSWNLGRVAIAWIEKSGFDVMDQIVNSITNSQTKVTVVSYVLNSVAETDPVGAFNYALGIGDDLFNSTIDGVARVWAGTDPEAALTAASQIDQAGLRTNLENSIVQSWAFANPREVLQKASTLPERLRTQAIKSAISRIAWIAPVEAADLVTELEPGPETTQIATDVVRTWAMRDAKATLDWILTESSVKDIQPQLLSTILYRLASFDPQLAMDTALSQPIAESGTGMELSVISALAWENVDEALKFIPQTRSGQTRLRAFQSVGTALISQNDVDRTLDLLQAVDDTEKITVFQPIAASWARNDSEGLLESMERLPSQQFRSKAAMALVLSNREYQRVLSDEQIEEAKKFLTDDDRQLLEGADSSTFGWW